MPLHTLIVFPDEARQVAAHTVASVEVALPEDGSRRPAMVTDGSLVVNLVRPVRGLPGLRDEVDGEAVPRMRTLEPYPIRWVAHAAEAAAKVMGHMLLRREGWVADELAAAGLGLLRRDPEGGWTDAGRASVRQWLFDPRRDEAAVMAVLRYAAMTGFWCIYSEDG